MSVGVDAPPRRRGRPELKGRQVEPAARHEVAAIIGAGPHPRDRLIENLHRIQDRTGHLAHRHLAALADLMRLSLVEVYEVATFYHGFDVVPDGESVPTVTIKVCDSLSCALVGAEALRAALASELGARARIEHAACMGRCDLAPAVRIREPGRDRYLSPGCVETVTAALDDPAIAAGTPEPGFDFAAYRAAGGYALLGECLDASRAPEAIIEALEAVGLRGLGGAGFPTGQKWRFVRREPGPRLMAINADESEPGTFKDRLYLLRDPHRFLEGMLIGAWAVEAAAVYIYLRDEYPDVRAILTDAIADLAHLDLELPPIHLRRGAGAYICGEESAMLESLEGKRGLPRHKPPFPSQVGLFGRPTLINNVETLFWVRDLVQHDAAWFTEAGRRGRIGLRSFSVSGRVRQPGVKLAPAGISARELIEEYCGGMAVGATFKAYLPGGASGGILPASMADLPLDFGTLEEHGAMIGSAGIIVLSDRDSTAEAALNLMRFFQDESCGQCTPCRVGTDKAADLMAKTGWDRPLLDELSQCMADASICGLGQAAPNALRSVFAHFPDDLKRREAP